MAKLSDTALILLNKAAERDDCIVEAPAKLPVAACNAVVRSLLKQHLLIEIPADPRNPMVWRTDEHDQPLVLRLTDEGFRALNLEPPGSEPAADPGATDAPTAPDATAVQAEALVVADALDTAHAAPVVAPRASLRDAAAAVLEEWDDRDNGQYGLPEAIARLRNALAARATRAMREPGAHRKPREGTKQQAVLALLGRTEGATIAQVMEATAWAPHTVRGFIAGLKKKGHTVEVLDRVRMVGPNKDGAKGSYSVYRVTTPAAG